MSMGAKATRWAGRRVFRRVTKGIPLVGTAVSLYYLADVVRRKGLVRGLVDTGLSAIPIVGTVKNGVELFTDDLIPDRPQKDVPAVEPRPPRRRR